MNPSDIEALPKTAGIYALVNGASGKRYVGSAVSFRRRIYEHHRRLEKGDHRNPHLQAAWKTAGAAAFTVQILEHVAGATDAELLPAESYWITYFDTVDSGYNICPVAGTRRGAKVSAESSARIGAAKRGNTYRRGLTLPEELRLRIAAKLRGNRLTEETKAKLSAIRKGRPKPAGFSEKMSAIHKGRIVSPEQRAQISAALTGRRLSEAAKTAGTEKRQATLARKVAEGYRRPATSPETKAKISASGKGRKLSADTRARMSAARRGKPQNLTEQQRALVAENMRKVWEQRRAEGCIGRGGRAKGKIR